MKKSFKAVLLIIAIMFSVFYWFYYFESADASNFRKEVYAAIKSNKKDVYLKDIFSSEWDMICPIKNETIYPGYPDNINDYMDVSFNNEIPNTFAFNYNYNVILLSKRQLTKVIGIKDPKFTNNNQNYYLHADDKITCYPRESAKIVILKSKNGYMEYYNVTMTAGK